LKVVDFNGFDHTAIYIAVCKRKHELELMCLACRPTRGKYVWTDLSVSGFATWVDELDNMEEALTTMKTAPRCITILQFDNVIDLAVNLQEVVETNTALIRRLNELTGSNDGN